MVPIQLDQEGGSVRAFYPDELKKPLPGVPIPGEPHTNLLASFSAEQTARFFAGGELGEPHIPDPQLRNALKRQGARLRMALFDEVVPALVRALRHDSQTSAQRLHYLAEHARNGDAEASRMMGAMIGELLTMAMNHTDGE